MWHLAPGGFTGVVGPILCCGPISKFETPSGIIIPLEGFPP